MSSEVAVLIVVVAAEIFVVVCFIYLRLYKILNSDIKCVHFHTYIHKYTYVHTY